MRQSIVAAPGESSPALAVSSLLVVSFRDSPGQLSKQAEFEGARRAVADGVDDLAFGFQKGVNVLVDGIGGQHVEAGDAVGLAYAVCSILRLAVGAGCPVQFQKEHI